MRSLRTDVLSTHRDSAAVLLLLVACLFAAGVRTASAQGAAREICVEPAQGSPGARVTVPLSLGDCAGVAAFQVDVHFDPAFLAYAGARLAPPTATLGTWVLDSQVLGVGLVRVLAYSFPSTGLAAGRKDVALIDFDLLATSAISGVPLPLSACILGDSRGLSIPCSICVQPGVDAAAPRFALSMVDDGFAFRPARLVIERSDWVLWKNEGLLRSHTTTSGAGCVQNGLWRGILDPGGRFSRRFLEPIGSLLPYFSEPDCTVGMTGEVEISDDITLMVSDAPPGSLLSWSGGIGRYRLHRSVAPSFVPPVMVSLSPDGGETGTTYAEAERPVRGQAFFYLVVNAF